MALLGILTFLALVLMHPLKVMCDTPPDLIVTCFDCGSSIPRAIAAAAANKFCDEHWKEVLYQSEPGESKGFVFNYYWVGLWYIQLKFVPFWNDEHGCTFDYNDFFVNHTICYYAFMAPIDYCNTGGVNDKQGGYWWTECGNVTINPNPGGAEGCPNSRPNWSPPEIGLQVIDYHATSEEYEGSLAASQELEKSTGQSSGLEIILDGMQQGTNAGDV